MLKEMKCVRYKDCEFINDFSKVVYEIPISMWVNGQRFVTAMASPDMKKEFVIGHLFTEGIIKTKEDIELLDIKDNKISVLLSDPLKTVSKKKIIVSGCGGEASFLSKSKIPKISSDLVIGVNAIFDNMSSILNSEFYKTTRGLHTVGLFNNKGACVIAYDIGRHNALDKVIGWGLMNDILFKESFVITTGRISSEMVFKCINANIPIIASKGATTGLSIDIAKDSGMALIGFVRGNSMNVYGNYGRIATS
ncbi:MAG: formate dehydrogenase accessory sulfurtransferase FdhD [Methanosarcinales archaeon]|nr:formate dehydrogenase accessory sulfurtransferase FdhD [Methanosarcinales archaeon]